MLLSKNGRLVSKIITYIVLVFFAIFCVFPFLWMLVTSLKPTDQIRTSNPSFFIENPTFSHFENVLVNTQFITFFVNSLIVAITTTIISMLVSIFAGYALSRFQRFKGIKIVNVTMLLSQMIPGVLLLIPLYILMQRLGLLDTYAAMILAYTTFMVPLCTFMLKGFIDSIPYELEEAAEIDGCSRLRIIYQIILPISIPSLVATALFAFVNAWNEFMFGYVFINDEAHRTLTPGITLFKGLYTTDWGSIMSASVLAVLPVVILFIYLQKFLIEGMTAGSVKG
ncbi:carbohydrate ABC transporter permease [Neobacillus sp. CF12]|jgi:multiple sugar transport system permease protein|uniref:carbohydrate ABC transporter permease n=1 Tax=Neobacillus sp. CF12 TaxID=3055864 RepID=UPI0025A2D4D5|nr:carbohydrate ABC transporter permease [Neobacillus sp. CF12]MDM5327681.1 carbohydrate ABC transporter permease [Neobacillus sp. CF12]